MRHEQGSPDAGRGALGRRGEDLAVDRLRERGWAVAARNWRCASPDVRGELDIVAWDGAVLVFCEVKTRRGTRAGQPVEAVGPRKQAQLRRLAGAYLSGERPRAAALRFDVIGVCWTGGPAPQFVHVQGAF